MAGVKIEDAVTAGLADKVGTFEDVLSSLTSSSRNLGGGISTRQKQIDLLKI